MADAAPAGDRGGFRGGFGDRGRWVGSPISCPGIVMTKDDETERLPDVLEKRSAEPGLRAAGYKITNEAFA